LGQRVNRIFLQQQVNPRLDLVVKGEFPFVNHGIEFLNPPWFQSKDVIGTSRNGLAHNSLGAIQFHGLRDRAIWNYTGCHKLVWRTNYI